MHFRIDDFPVGTPDERINFSHIQQILSVFEDAQIAYWLGVVPASTTEELASYLESLKYGIVAIHGFDHGFSKWRPVDHLGGEFQDMGMYELIRLYQTWQRQIPILGTANVFIPPFNVFTQAVLDFLNFLSFEIITGGPETVRDGMDKLRFRKLELVLSLGKFYGKAKDMIDAFGPEDYKGTQVACLHLGWENVDDVKRLVEHHKRAIG